MKRGIRSLWVPLLLCCFELTFCKKEKASRKLFWKGSTFEPLPITPLKREKNAFKRIYKQQKIQIVFITTGLCCSKSDFVVKYAGIPVIFCAVEDAFCSDKRLNFK